MIGAAGPEAGHVAWEVLHIGIHSGLPVGLVLWAALIGGGIAYLVNRSTES
jgi:hypothetical protein